MKELSFKRRDKATFGPSENEAGMLEAIGKIVANTNIPNLNKDEVLKIAVRIREFGWETSELMVENLLRAVIELNIPYSDYVRMRDVLNIASESELRSRGGEVTFGLISSLTDNALKEMLSKMEPRS